MNVQGCSLTIKFDTTLELSSKLPKWIVYILKLQNYSTVQEQDKVMHVNTEHFYY